MIKIYSQATHSKLIFEDKNSKAYDLVSKSFIAKDTKLENDPRVKNGYMSPYENFFIEEEDILPTGLLPYLFKIYEKNNVKYEHIELRKFPGIDKDFLLRLVRDEISFTTKKGDIINPKDRPYQKECVLKVIKEHGGIINLPTASGKTLVSALITLAYKKHPILFIFDRIDLVHQTYNDFINELEFDEKEIGMIQGNNYKYDKDTRIILLSMQSYEKAFHIFPKIKVILSDEVHITGRTETAQKVIYSCQNAPIHIGLSATPDRINNPAEQLRLYSVMGPIVYNKKIKEQQDDNFIAETKVKIYHVNFPNDEMIEVTGSYNDVYDKEKLSRSMIESELRKEYKITIKEAKNKIKQYFDEDKKIEEVENIINQIINNWCTFIGQSVVKEDDVYYLRKFVAYGDESTHYIHNEVRNNLIAKVAKEHERVLVLFNKIAHGEELLKKIPGSVLIHGAHKKDERDKAEEYLKNNSGAIVLASKIWGTGKNIPEIETYINAGGGVSEIEQIQKMGRAIRLSPNSGKTHATIIDFKDMFSPLAIKQSNIRLRVYRKENLDITMILEK